MSTTATIPAGQVTAANLIVNQRYRLIPKQGTTSTITIGVYRGNARARNGTLTPYFNALNRFQNPTIGFLYSPNEYWYVPDAASAAVSSGASIGPASSSGPANAGAFGGRRRKRATRNARKKTRKSRNSRK